MFAKNLPSHKLMRSEPGNALELLQCEGYYAVHIRVHLRHRSLCTRVCSMESRPMCREELLHVLGYVVLARAAAFRQGEFPTFWIWGKRETEERRKRN